MTWPFDNNTRVVIKRLANGSMKADKRRNLFVIITIAFAVCLMSAFAFYYTATNARSIEQIRGQYQAGCIQTTHEEISRLAAADKFEQYGYESDMETVQYRDSNLIVMFQDSGMQKLDRWDAVTGTLPQQANEIIVERAFLNYYQLPQNTGQRLFLDLGEGEREYMVSGILEKKNTSRVFSIFISEAAADMSGNPAPYTLKFRFQNSRIEEPEQLKADIAAFFEEMGIPKDRTFYSSNYFDITDLYLGSDMPVYVVALFIAVACSIVIYNIFHISVMGKMKEYGRLKVIGATPKQLQAVVRKERSRLSLISIPAGLLAGALLSCLIFPGYWVWADNLKYAAVVVALIGVVILISTRKPVKMAGRVSAIESVRATAYANEASSAVSHKLHHKLDAFHLALMNFSRSRKKTAVTLTSLGLTGILLMCIGAYSGSIDLDEMARAQMGDGGEYLLAANAYGKELLSFQKENLLNDALKEQLERLSDVERITSYSAAPVLIPQIKENENFTLFGLTKEQIETILPPEKVQNGAVDYDRLLSENGILFIRDPENLMKLLYHTEYSVGDQITLETVNGHTRTFTVQGIVDGIKTGSGANFFILPEPFLHELYPDINHFTTCFNIHVTQDSQKLRENIFSLVKNPKILITSHKDLADSLAPSMNGMVRAAYGLLGFIFLFALMNLINTLITNILSRQQEFGVFQAVGMSGRQLFKMLSWECLLYILATLLITLTLGTACSIGVCAVFSQIGTFGKLTYHFPIMVFFTFAAALSIVQIIFSAGAVWYSKKHSLVERIKTMD